MADAIVVHRNPGVASCAPSERFPSLPSADLPSQKVEGPKPYDQDRNPGYELAIYDGWTEKASGAPLRIEPVKCG